MSTADTRGPVELAVIEFPGSQFNGEILPALTDLVGSGIVQILDLVVVTKEEDGSITSVEITDLGDDVFGEIEGEAGGLLSEDDIAAAGDALSPGSTALAIVWENSWARRLIDAIIGSGGRLVAHDRLDAEAVNEILAEFAES